MVERGAEVLPQWRMRTWIVRREKQRQHIQQAESARRPDANAQEQSHADSQFAIRDKKRDWCCMWKNQDAQHLCHEGIRAVGEKTIDPELKAAVQRKLRAEDLVLTENQKESADGKAQKGECA